MRNADEERYQIQNAGDRVDGISQLPDCILHHILSCIPTKDVMKTSILSKRWENLWTSVPNLDFDDVFLYTGDRFPSEERKTCFVNFVERFLLLRDASHIKKFQLSCHVYFNKSRMHSWISAAIMRNVHEIEICVSVYDTFMLPSAMFCSVSLTNLKIKLNCVLELPNSISLPHLKTLDLSLVTFRDDVSTQRLLSGCPVLEELLMVDCVWKNLTNITISSSTLESLTIDDPAYVRPLDSRKGCNITIDASNLMYLKYVGYPANEIFLNDVSSLVNAFIGLWIPHHKQVMEGDVIELLRGLQNVVSFTISNHPIKSFVLAGYVMTYVSDFQYSTYLHLSVETGVLTIAGLMRWLKRFPNLQSLCLYEGFMNEACLVEIWSSLPECIPFGLKTLTFKNFYGNDTEICFVKCVLQHALAFEKLNICNDNVVGDPNQQKKVKKVLETIARGSKSCVLTFS